MRCCCSPPPELQIPNKDEICVRFGLKFKALSLAFKLTITNEEIFAVDGRVKLAVSSYRAPLETCLRLISRFEQSDRQIVI